MRYANIIQMTCVSRYDHSEVLWVLVCPGEKLGIKRQRIKGSKAFIGILSTENPESRLKDQQ